MSEEFGWRGDALARLQARFSALTSSVVLGLVDGLWHYPLIIIGSWWQDSVLLLLQWFVITDNTTGGNLLAMMLFHGMGNTQSDIIWCCGAAGHIYIVYAVAAMLVVLVFGAGWLSRRPLVPIPRPEP